MFKCTPSARQLLSGYRRQVRTDSSKLLARDDFINRPGNPRCGPLLPGLGQEPARRFVNGWLQVVREQTLPLDACGAFGELGANSREAIRLRHQIDRGRREIAGCGEQTRVRDSVMAHPVVDQLWKGMPGGQIAAKNPMRGCSN